MPSRPAPHRLPWGTLTTTALVALAQLLPGAIQALQYDRGEVAGGAFHRLLGGHLVHWSPSHLAYDLAAFLILGIVVELRRPARWLLAVVATALAASLTLHLALPEITTYRGLSAIDSALFTALLLDLWRQARAASDRRGALLVAALATLFAAKLAYETLTGAALFAGGDAATVLPQLHLVGAAVGALGGFFNPAGAEGTSASAHRQLVEASGQ